MKEINFEMQEFNDKHYKQNNHHLQVYFVKHVINNSCNKNDIVLK